MSRKSTLTPEAEAEILRLYGDEELRLSMGKVSAKTGTTPAQVRRVTGKAGITRPRGKAAVAAGEAARIAGAVEGGESIRVVAARHRRSEAVIREVLYRAGAPRPDVDHLHTAAAAAIAGITVDDLRVLARLGLVASTRLSARGRRLYLRADCLKIAAMRSGNQP